jgi:hypothetical protein
LSAQLSFDFLDEVSTVVDTLPPRTPIHAATDGCGRLMRALVRAGLPEDAWLSAASLILALEAEAAEP